MAAPRQLPALVLILVAPEQPSNLLVELAAPLLVPHLVQTLVVPAAHLSLQQVVVEQLTPAPAT
jgi:hypothetical protein